MIGDGALGVFDASHCDDPNNPSVVWRACSVVDLSPTYGWGAISTRVAVSQDRAASFLDQGLVNPSVDLPEGLAVVNEVPSLFYDASEPPASRWKMVFMVVHNSQQAQGDSWKQFDYSKSWFALRSAPRPSGPWSPAIKLLAGSLHDDSFGGPPRFETDSLIVSEPGALGDAGGFWLAYQAPLGGSPGNSQVRMSRYLLGGQVRQECGSFFSASDVILLRLFHSPLRSMSYFAAPNLVRRNGRFFLMVTPADESNNYLGTAVFEIADPYAARLTRAWYGVPKLLKWIAAPTSFGGAGAYSANSTRSGVVVSCFSLSQSPPFQLWNTGVQIP